LPNSFRLLYQFDHRGTAEPASRWGETARVHSLAVVSAAPFRSDLDAFTVRLHHSREQSDGDHEPGRLRLGYLVTSHAGTMPSSTASASKR
jgi:hypothetical protein